MAFLSFPPTVQAAYLELLAAVMTAPLPARGVSYIKRAARGRDYWYLQYVIGDSKRSFYLGPDNDELGELIAQAKQLRRNDAADIEQRERLVATVVAGGMYAPTATEARVYEALAQAGVFAGGGVLVGSHAFSNIGNLLGVRWETQITRTSDIDIARDPAFEVVAPAEPQDLEQLLRESHKAFFAVPSLNPKHPSTSFRIRGHDLSVSLLTPMRGEERGKPVHIPALRAAAEPVRFLDFLMEDAQLAAVPARAGILIHVPNPARFALHKLVVSQRRPAAFAAKSRKDIAQADAVLAVLLDLRPADVRMAMDAATGMGEKFMAQLRAAAEHLGQRNKIALASMYSPQRRT